MHLHENQLRDYKNQFSQLGAVGDALRTQREIEELEKKSDMLSEKKAEYKDKIMELKFTVEGVESYT